MNDGNGPSLDLTAASSAAMEKLGTSDISNAPDRSSAVSPPPTSGQPPSSDPTVEIEFSPGKKEAVTLQQLKEWRESGLRQQDYTRKTQEVAEMRRQAEQVYRAYQQMEQERQQLQEFFSDEENVLKLVAQQYGPQAMQKLMGMLSGQQQQPQYDPNAPATLEQAQRIAQQQAQQVRQELAKLQQQVGSNVAQELQNLRQEQETQEYKKVLNPVVSKIFEENPILSAVDGMEEVIRFKVFQAKPQSVEQAIELFNSIGKEQAEKLSAKFTELNKQTIANKQKLLQNGIEPAGGVPPSAEPRRFKKSNGDIDWKGISAQAESYMKSRGGF